MKQRSNLKPNKLESNWSERKIQQTCVFWLQQAYPDVVFWAVPNEGKRTSRYGAALKAQGMKKGTPDLNIFFNGRALFIETKTVQQYNSKNHGCSPVQLKMHDKLRKQGFRVEVLCEVSRFQEVVHEFIEESL